MEPSTSYVSWEAALSVAGAAMMVWSVNAALAKALGDIWTDRMSRVMTLIVAIGVTESLAITGGTNSWAVYMLQFINGCIVSLAVVPVQPTTIMKVSQFFNKEE